MRKNDRARPHNWCVVQAQLSEKDAELFHRIMKANGCSTSDIVKRAVHAFLEEYRKEEEKMANHFLSRYQTGSEREEKPKEEKQQTDFFDPKQDSKR